MPSHHACYLKALKIWQATWDASYARWLRQQDNCGKNQSNYIRFYDPQSTEIGASCMSASSNR